MNGNNSWKKMAPFARLPRHDLGPVSQAPAGGLVSMGGLMEGGGEPFRGDMPAPAMMPQQQMPLQQDYDEGQAPQGKKILGMPKDQFIALMGTIAHAFGGDSPSGRMGSGLINMANMMREERMGQAKTRATETKEKRKAAAEAAKEKREAATKKKGKAPTVRTFRVGDMDVQHAFDYETRGWKPIPGMPGKKVEPPAGEKPKKMSFAEKRTRAKELRSTEISILDPENLENPAIQANIDFFNETTDKPYVYHRTPGTPAKETGWFDLERDVEAIPSTIEKVDTSTPEKVRDSGLPVEMKLDLLRSRFGYE